MARQRITRLTEPGEKPGMFGNKKDYNQRVSKRASEDKHNRLVDEADALISKLPKQLQGEAIRGIVDGTIDIKEFVSSPVVQRNAAIATGTAAALAGVGGMAKAYSDQANEYAPTNPIAVTGRAVSNLFTPMGGGPSADPLASARNHVASARSLVGTEAMMSALAEDEIKQLRAEQNAANGAMPPFNGNLQEMIDLRAAELMETPVIRSDGSVMPMSYDKAMRLATEQIHMQMRAEQVY